MAINDRLARLEGSQPCQECPYPARIRTFRSTRIVYGDGSVDFQRDPRLRDSEPSPPKLCQGGPYALGGLKPPIRAIHIVRTVRAGQDEY